jgi:hypothetical protein
MTDDDVLIRQVSETFQAYSSLVTAPPQRFDPTHRMTEVIDADVFTTVRSTRRTRADARLVAAVAAIALALAGIAGWAVGPGGDDTGSTELVTMSAPVAPTDGLAPAWAPEGYELSQVDWSTASSSTSTFGPLLPVQWETYGARAQLFGDPADPTVALLVESAGGVLPEDIGDRVTVRGQSGYVVPSDERGIIGPTREDVVVVTWTEGGTELRASFRGLGRDEALGALDALQVRPGGPAAGFDAPPDAGLTPLGEAAPSPTPATQVSAAYDGSTSSGPGPTVLVDVVSATGQTTVPYLNAWLYGERVADGTATVWDPSTSTRTIVRPDGQAIRAELFTLDEADSVVPADEIVGVGSAEQVTAEIAGSVASVSAAQLTSWWDGVNEERASMPLMARVDLPSAAIELRGDQDDQALCHATTADTVCFPAPVDDLHGNLFALGRIDGTDYVVAASREHSPQIVGLGADGPYVVGAETGRDGAWHIALAPAPGDPFTVYGEVADELELCLGMLETAGRQDRADEIRQGDDGAIDLVSCYAETDG